MGARMMPSPKTPPWRCRASWAETFPARPPALALQTSRRVKSLQTRKKISHSSDVAIPHSSDVSVNPVTHIINMLPAEAIR